jgi:hypothetical protein
LITYRKRQALRIRRYVTPEPPFYAATAVSPYTSDRDPFVAIDYFDSTATAVDRAEVGVCEAPSEHFVREKMIREPLLIDATGAAESEFRAGADLLQAAVRLNYPTVLVVTRDGYLSSEVAADVTVIAAWPLELALGATRGQPQGLSLPSDGVWGVAIPIVPPLTTELPFLLSVVEEARNTGAAFVAPIALDVDPVARNAAVSRFEEVDDETFSWMFDERFDLMVTATERHIAALASEHGMSDHVPLPVKAPLNWRAAALLSRTGHRLQKLERDVELAWLLQKSARVIASLKKPIDVIASAASLGIVNGVDDTSVEIVEEWLRDGKSGYVDSIDAAWRLRRDHYR